MPEKNTPLTQREALERKLSTRPIKTDMRRQRLLNELLAQPEVVGALEQLVTLKKRGAAELHNAPGFRAAQPPKVSAKPKRSPGMTTGTVLVEPELEQKALAEKRKFQELVKRLPGWLTQLKSSEDRHRFALRYFSALYQGGFWLECLSGKKWNCADAFGQVQNVDPEVLGRSSFAVAAMETSKVVTALPEYVPGVLQQFQPIHFFILEKPTVEKRSLFCCYGIPEYGELQQFMILSALYTFQRPY